MTLQDRTDYDRFREFAGKARAHVIEGMAKVYGGHARDDVRLSGEEEINEWRRPSSPAALKVLEQGGTLEDAERANAMHAEYLKGQQAAARQLGWDAKKLAEAGLDDDGIFRQCRAQAWEMTRANGKASITEQIAYQERMEAKVAAHRAKQQASAPAAPEMEYANG